VAADELARLDVALQLLGKVEATLGFGLAAAVGEEDVRTGRVELVSGSCTGY
jgi:hypothetical protein